MINQQNNFRLSCFYNQLFTKKILKIFLMILDNFAH